MDWVCLGHAMWLVCAGQLRILFDPLLDDVHMGGVLEVCPRRHVAVEALLPDFIFVSHAHPDHFDPESLRRLAALDPETVLVTSDPFVADVARQLGFLDARTLQAGMRVELAEAVRLVTTPSLASEPEWGIAVATEQGTVWHQVDTVLRDAAHVRIVVDGLMRGLGRAQGERLSMALVRAQPLIEVAAQIGEATGFVFAEYAALLEQIAAIDARSVVPTSAGARHGAPFRAMNEFVYPVSGARAVADLRSRLRDARVFEPETGGRWQVREGRVDFEPGGGASLVQVTATETPVFRPLGLPPLVDPDLDGGPVAPRRDQVRRWVHDVLAPSLAPSSCRRAEHASRPLCVVLEVVWPSVTDVFTLSEVDSPGEAWRVEARFEPEYDVLNQIAGSMLHAVVDGRRHWGEPLLSGLLRAVHRAYEVDRAGLRRLDVPTIFLYRALPYAQSVQNWVQSQL